MIGELLSAVRDAEGRAVKIVADAHTRAAKIEADAQAEIEKINMETENMVIKIYAMAQTPREDDVKTETPKVETDKERITAAKKFITDEFHKRYGK
jgi:hypothetical protein